MLRPLFSLDHIEEMVVRRGITLDKTKVSMHQLPSHIALSCNNNDDCDLDDDPDELGC